jgi:2-dehydro-3-deoxygluconokinase
MGLYWAETGTGLRATEVFYDRSHSAFIELAPEAWQWDTLLHGASRLHLTGITPALGPNGTRTALRAAEAATTLGIPVSFDGNYRARLWEAWDGRPQETLNQLVGCADILFGDHRDIGLLVGTPLPGDEVSERRAAAEAAFALHARLTMIASTKRTVRNADEHSLSARIDTRAEAFETAPIPIPAVVDRIGAGDAFAAGVLIERLAGSGLRQTATMSATLAALKHTIPGDAFIGGQRQIESFARAGCDVRR